MGTIDERFQSFNVEMLEVTGGRFWKPYSSELRAPLAHRQRTAQSGSDTPAGMDPNLYEYRLPIDLTDRRLRKLAAALAPAYVRVSGTWANTTYFPDSDNASSVPPAGFSGVLTRTEWHGVVEFSKAVDAQIVTSFATSLDVKGGDQPISNEDESQWIIFNGESHNFSDLYADLVKRGHELRDRNRRSGHVGEDGIRANEIPTTLVREAARYQEDEKRIGLVDQLGKASQVRLDGRFRRSRARYEYALLGVAASRRQRAGQFRAVSRRVRHRRSGLEEGLHRD